MAPKRRGARAAPTAKRGRVGDSRCLRVSDTDAGAQSEPSLAVANHLQRLVRFYRSEDDKMFVELTTLWRWLSGLSLGLIAQQIRLRVVAPRLPGSIAPIRL